MTTRRALALRVTAGPLTFAAVQLTPLTGLGLEAHLALSTYAWMLAWWAARPVPWAVTSFLPLLVFPLAGVMPIREVSALYGQPILPFVLGVMLLGHAFRKHGVALRLAMTVLSIPGVASSRARLVLVILAVTAILSMFVDDAAAVAIMIPIAMAVAHFATDHSTSGPSDDRSSPWLASCCLAVLYGSAAGGLATPAGVPFNSLTISLLEQLTPYEVSFAQWMLTGGFLTVATGPVYFLVLRWMGPLDTQPIANGAAHFRSEKSRLGVMTQGEKNVVLVLGVMVALWLLPVVVSAEGLNIWYVPAVGMLLLFLLPVNAQTGEMTLTARDFQDGVAWNTVLLVLGGAALASGLVTLGITDWFGSMITPSLSAATLPAIAGLVTPLLSHVTSGTATTIMISTTLFPIATELGYNPAILARIIAGTALAVSVPWAGAAAATTFASGAVPFGTMFRVGVVATALTAVVATVLSVILVPALGAFTVMQ